MNDPRELLDRLDQARDNAAVGSLRVGQHYGIHMYAGENPIGMTLRAADAALIVAAVNALPQLTAALQDVLEECDELDADAVARGLRLDRATPPGDRIRAVVQSALTADPTSQEGGDQ